MDEYRENIRKAHEEVSRWPKWKQGAVGVSTPGKHKSQSDIIASLEAQLAVAREELEKNNSEWREMFNEQTEALKTRTLQLAASRERERKLAEQFLIHENEWDSRPSQASAEETK